MDTPCTYTTPLEVLHAWLNVVGGVHIPPLGRALVSANLLDLVGRGGGVHSPSIAALLGRYMGWRAEFTSSPPPPSLGSLDFPQL